MRGGGCFLQADTNGNLCTKTNGKTVKYITQDDYKIGDIYLTTSTESPASRFGGTWEKLTHDAYFKIVTSGAGGVSGTNAQHIIPVESMPQHKHGLPITTGTNTGDTIPYKLWSNSDNFRAKATSIGGMDTSTDIVGNSKSYYPYYYGIYAWVKRAM